MQVYRSMDKIGVQKEENLELNSKKQKQGQLQNASHHTHTHTHTLQKNIVPTSNSYAINYSFWFDIIACFTDHGKYIHSLFAPKYRIHVPMKKLLLCWEITTVHTISIACGSHTIKFVQGWISYHHHHQIHALISLLR